MRKPRLLAVGEASYLSTGFATCQKALQEAFFGSGKYEVAELATCHDPNGVEDRRRAAALPWKVYANIPADPSRRALFDPKGRHQFGEFSFDEVCLDYRPDIVWDIRDPWMVEFAGRSPFRDLFHWVVQATVDATPQPAPWLSTYASADAVLTYTDWGADVLRREGGGLINVVGSASPGADTDTFRPLDRRALRARFGVPDDALVVGTVMRNQPRKLIPRLIDDFAEFVRGADPAVSSRYLLYLHTSYPDRGWDLPSLVKHSGISGRILITYKCRQCGAVSAARYSDARTHCFACNDLAAGLTHTRAGVTTEQLAEVMNLFDLFVQYASFEGLGMPAVEAAACGIPLMEVDYSAMSDVVRKLGGRPLKVALFTKDVTSGRDTAVPDREDFVRALAEFFGKSEAERAAQGVRAREGVLAHFTWGQAAARWMSAFDPLPLRPWAETWGSPPRLHTPVPPPASFPSNEELVRWCLVNYLGRPDLAGGHTEVRLIRELNWGSRVTGEGTEDFGVETMLREMAAACRVRNEWELKRFANFQKGLS